MINNINLNFFHADFIQKKIKSTCFSCIDMFERTKNIIQNGDIELGTIHLNKAISTLLECIELNDEAIKKINEIRKQND